jgi:surface antigen
MTLESDAKRPAGYFLRTKKKILRVISERRFIRYSLLALNIMVLGGIVTFVLQSNPSNNVTRSSVAASANSDTPSDPLDQLSTADIAVNLAQMANLAETPAVTNQADSASTELIVPAQNVVIAKPQAVTTELKSNRDITNYVVAEGDTIASIAAKFNVTSESILWSNNITGNAVAIGTKLAIPPVTGIVYTVQAGDTPDSLAQKFRASKEQIIAYNDAEISGLQVGKQIIVPNGQQLAAAPSRTSYAAGSTGASGFTAAYGSNGYDYGFCTWYVANRRAQIGRPLPSNLGDAWTWDDRAASAGIRVDNTPAVGAAVVTKTSVGPGHVAFVEAVNDDGSVWISEMNSSGQRSMTDSSRAGGWGQVDYKLIPASAARSYNYIH